jgi:hypothetical protein
MMFEFTRGLGYRAITAGIAAAAVAGLSTVAVRADGAIKDASIGTYVRWGADKVNIRLDKVERVDHIDARPIASAQNLKDPTNGYTILSFSVQNAGAPVGAREASVTEIFDDGSQIDGHTSGPFIGAARTLFQGHLEHNQTVHIRYVQMNTPADRKITKIILKPGDGGATLRYTVKDSDIARLPEIPLPSPAP